jgi:nitrate/TMAO reductase-like tetraheme cytochrome c subunit
MANAPHSQVRKPFPILSLLVLAVILVILLAAAGFGFAASQESHDSFCASCHSQPESTYFARSTSTPPVDLASFHTGQKTNCINCHSGQGIISRMQAELLGARNAFKWYTGTAIQPAVMTYPIEDQNCLKCHQDVTQRGFAPKEQIAIPGLRQGGEGERGGRNNHWHQFMTRWQAATAAAGSCVSCHSGHTTSASPQSGFMNAQNVQATCDACHKAIRRED